MHSNVLFSIICSSRDLIPLAEIRRLHISSQVSAFCHVTQLARDSAKIHPKHLPLATSSRVDLALILFLTFSNLSLKSCFFASITCFYIYFIFYNLYITSNIIFYFNFFNLYFLYSYFFFNNFIILLILIIYLFLFYF